MSYLIVFLGAGIGGAVRHSVNLGSARLLGTSFPYGTIVVNVVGSLLIGLLAGLFLSRPGISQDVRLFLTTGVLGGFTTFSAFSLDAALLIQRDALLAAAGYVILSVGLGLIAFFAGLVLARTGIFA